ncbi:hypothetical protein P5V15_011247 [Pogonomyrmex californicus]
MVKTMARAAEEENLNIKFVTFGCVKGFKSFQEIIQEQQDAINDFRCSQISSLEEIVALFLSSGSTGPSKATMMSHRALINNMLYDTSFATEDQKVVMWFSPLRWIMGTITTIWSIYFCKTRIITIKLDSEETCKLLEKYNVCILYILYI